MIALLSIGVLGTRTAIQKQMKHVKAIMQQVNDTVVDDWNCHCEYYENGINEYCGPAPEYDEFFMASYIDCGRINEETLYCMGTPGYHSDDQEWDGDQGDDDHFYDKDHEEDWGGEYDDKEHYGGEWSEHDANKVDWDEVAWENDKYNNWLQTGSGTGQPPKKDEGEDKPPKDDEGEDKPPKQDEGEDKPPKDDEGEDKPPKDDEGEDKPPKDDEGEDKPPKEDEEIDGDFDWQHWEEEQENGDIHAGHINEDGYYILDMVFLFSFIDGQDMYTAAIPESNLHLQCWEGEFDADDDSDYFDDEFDFGGEFEGEKKEEDNESFLRKY